MRNIIVQLMGVSKKYNHKELFRNINISIGRGQSIAITGHNGIGKSTLLKIIAGLVQPSGGRVLLNGSPLFHYIPERFPKMALSAHEYIRHMGAMDGLSGLKLNQRIDELSKMFYMESMMNISMNKLSKGSLQKVGVIQAMLTQPDVLLLDEPLSGQDADSQKAFVWAVDDFRQRGCAVLLSCHEEHLINRISDEVYGISNNGLYSIDTARVDTAMDILYLHVDDAEDVATVMAAFPYRYQASGQHVEIKAPSYESNALIQVLLAKGWQLRGMRNENDGDSIKI